MSGHVIISDTHETFKDFSFSDSKSMIHHFLRNEANIMIVFDNKIPYDIENTLKVFSFVVCLIVSLFLYLFVFLFLPSFLLFFFFLYFEKKCHYQLYILNIFFFSPVFTYFFCQYHFYILNIFRYFCFQFFKNKILYCVKSLKKNFLFSSFLSFFLFPFFLSFFFLPFFLSFFLSSSFLSLF
ncbi:unnamed protein product [Acanthosepion pharaonis]|uniref:Uncharacterized protein n=1 Tax=Acanthosepion pharaonis TaxID=158019 RepID=A0A812B628_ACAPH|nr:unnamed protein product [Sepia pharaonis]